MHGKIPLNAIDLTIFAVYMVVAVALGFLVSRRGRTSSKAYFLGGKTLPWYVVATSMVAADVSAEHFIANAGVAYRYGIVPATGSWNTWIIYSLFLWIFLPYYVRTGLYTMPEFLERRFNATCRYIFAASLVVVKRRWTRPGRPLGEHVVPAETAVDDGARDCRRARTGESSRLDAARPWGSHRGAAVAGRGLRGRGLIGLP